MKLLWVKTDFLHPTTRGGQIRSLEMLRRLHSRHEIHYIAFEDPAHPEGVIRSREYCRLAYPIKHHLPPRHSLSFAGQLIAGLFSPEPVSIRRYRSAAMREAITRVVAQGFDRIICDFLTPAVNFPDISQAIVFQHNVESVIWDRYAATAESAPARAYLRVQARRMRRFERRICTSAGHVIAVSKLDADNLRQTFGVTRISHVATGVDVDFFTPKSAHPKVADLVFVGSMDWLPNIDGVKFFLNQVWPLIRRRLPDCSVAVVGRAPTADLTDLARREPRLVVTGTVEDVRPFLWGSTVAIVPLRIGGGTRLKIYEAMAARIPVVSTTVGAEGLSVSAPGNIRLADTASDFANECLDLLTDPEARARIATSAWEMVSTQFSWESVARHFEGILESTSRSLGPGG